MPERFSIEPVAGSLPDGLADLAARAEAEGIGIVTRVIDEWADGSHRFDRPGESLLHAVSTEAGGVAEHAEVIGIGGITVCHTVPEALRVRRFYVHPDWRRRGVAQALASRVVEVGLAHSEILTCHAGASDAAVPFWEAVGFEPIDRPGITHVLRR